ncbi:MAG TPA: hypothetical protein VNZ64_00680 [Candidatus Acidoferrum sp.]|nr:hypothetical protein [Candidatus Acidoferrum sp.]
MNALAENLGDTLSRLTPIPLPPPGPASAGTAPAPAQTAISVPPPQPQPSSSDDKGARRGNGKIPHLAKEHIDAINQFFDAGDTFRVVRQKLAQRGLDVNLANLSSWYHGGYQDHLHARERRDQVLQTQQLLLEFARDPRAPDLTLVGLHLGVTQLSQQLLEMVPGPHKEHFQTDTAQYLRMLNTLARMSKSLLALQKYQDDSTNHPPIHQSINPLIHHSPTPPGTSTSASPCPTPSNSASSTSSTKPGTPP